MYYIENWDEGVGVIFWISSTNFYSSFWTMVLIFSMSLFISSLSCFNWAALTIYANILTFGGLASGAIEIGYGGWSLIEGGPVGCPALPPIISSGVGFYIQIGIASSGGSIKDEA